MLNMYPWTFRHHHVRCNCLIDVQECSNLAWGIGDICGIQTCILLSLWPLLLQKCTLTLLPARTGAFSSRIPDDDDDDTFE
ncbi:hypothetical protein Vadar_025717 [Vaccinium darrowii]|uniref:Uncharacterized protein n=1 Tax=Vaccinium darrowii TaxID=229202 RepID=A0ACB7Y1W4_9ERIC|nr:hypothetical protein Vadar_025717 [Vaccinium darrowii]